MAGSDLVAIHADLHRALCVHINLETQDWGRLYGRAKGEG
jgi:hypothetical protein